MIVMTFLIIRLFFFNEVNGTEKSHLALAEYVDYVFCSQICSADITQQYKVISETERGCISHLARSICLASLMHSAKGRERETASAL